VTQQYRSVLILLSVLVIQPPDMCLAKTAPNNYVPVRNIEACIKNLNKRYGDVPSVADCSTSVTSPVIKKICGSKRLRRLAVLNSMVTAYNTEKNSPYAEVPHDMAYGELPKESCRKERCIYEFFMTNIKAILGDDEVSYPCVGPNNP
jgi:hypothetical protein